MSNLILVTGGARSGKSSYAEKRAKEVNGKTLYIATAIPFDDEMKDRIKKHQNARPHTWDTYEGYKNIGDHLENHGSQYSCILLDCVTLLVTNLMFEYSTTDDFETITQQQINLIEEQVIVEIEKIIKSIKQINGTVIMVTNELGLGLVPENKMSRVFRDMQGRVNQIIGQTADELYITVCGMPMKVK